MSKELYPHDLQLVHTLVDREVANVVTFQENHELPEGQDLKEYLGRLRELREKLEDMLQEKINI